MTTPEVWVIVDHRTGNAVQAIAIAESLGFPYEVKHMEYNIFAKLPNMLLGNSCMFLKDKSKESLKIEHPPKLVISCGRRTALVSAYLKQKYPNVKLVQVMRPGMSADIFDLIVLPQHDKFNKTSKAEVIRTIGALNNIPARIEQYKDNLVSKYPSMKSFIGVLVGGNTKDYGFTEADCREFAYSIENAIAYNGIPAFISFSRRTPEHTKKIFRDMFVWPNIIYDPTDINASMENPYIAMLKFAKFLALTCDSVSMCSEVASTGKPMYVYCPPNFSSKKHKYFLQQLVDLNIAKQLGISTGIMEEYQYTPLNEVEKVVEYIREKLL